MAPDCLPLSLAVSLAKLDIIESETKPVFGGAWQNVSVGSLFKSNINPMFFVFLDASPAKLGAWEDSTGQFSGWSSNARSTIKYTSGER